MKRSLDVAAIVLTALLLLAFAALSLRGLIAPEQASARFGAPVADAAGSLFYWIYLSGTSSPSPARYSCSRDNGHRSPFF